MIVLIDIFLNESVHIVYELPLLVDFLLIIENSECPFFLNGIDLLLLFEPYGCHSLVPGSTHDIA